MPFLAGFIFTLKTQTKSDFKKKGDKSCCCHDLHKGEIHIFKLCLSLMLHAEVEEQTLHVLFSACECNPIGSVATKCDLDSGQCSCRSNYGSRDCSACADGYFGYPNCECELSNMLHLWSLFLLLLSSKQQSLHSCWSHPVYLFIYQWFTPSGF